MASESGIFYKNVNAGGLSVDLYSLDAFPDGGGGTTPSSEGLKGVSLVFLLHGRMETIEGVNKLRDGLFDQVKKRKKEGESMRRGLVVAIFAQRNHGSRMVNEHDNLGWSSDPKKHNPQHALQMYVIQNGTAQDVSSLMDVLPAYLYPSDERVIEEFVVVGVSLGGHSTWLSLANENRTTVGVPIVGCPDYLKLMEPRALAAGLSLDPPTFPNQLRRDIAVRDPVNALTRPVNPFEGKKILAIFGGKDNLVPKAKSEDFLKRLNVGQNGALETFTHEEVGHACTPVMIEKMAEFVWRHSLKA